MGRHWESTASMGARVRFSIFQCAASCVGGGCRCSPRRARRVCCFSRKNHKQSSLFIISHELTWWNIENSSDSDPGFLVMLGDSLSSTCEQTTPASASRFLQNSTPSNKNSFGVVFRKNESVGPKMLLSSMLTSGRKNAVSDSTVCRIDCGWKT